MNAVFEDLEDESNPSNGAVLSNAEEVTVLLDSLRDRWPFICELRGENGFIMQLGIGEPGCVHFISSDGMPPYLLAVNNCPDPSIEEVEFMCGGTPTPFDGRNCITFQTLKEIAVEFIESGTRSSKVEWEEA